MKLSMPLLKHNLKNIFRLSFLCKRLFITVVTIVPAFPLVVTADTYNEFHNITLTPAGAFIANCFVQDSQGLMWFGTDKGLFSYNGYTVKPHLITTLPNANIIQSRINCGIMYDTRYMWLGSDNGVLIYDTHTDLYTENPTEFPTDIRSLCKRGSELWIGTLNGLYMYDTTRNKLENLSKRKNSGIPHNTIYSILHTSKDEFYVGTYNGLCFQDRSTGLFRNIELPTPISKNNLLVNALLEDTIRNCIWIGTEGFLFNYDPAGKLIERIPVFDDNSVKSLSLDINGNLFIGTDNGLYIYQPEKEEVRHIVHDSRFENSLINNIIWSIFIDKDNNSWIGTDYGISMFEADKIYHAVTLSQLTGKGDGNQLQSIFRDSRRNLWLGGTNGLIVAQPDKKSYLWYKMGDKSHPVSHNRIRSIYEDKQQHIWIATDGSINRYDYAKKQFVQYAITDSTNSRNANWAYSILEDKDGKLWIASCLGGIFVVDKQKLLENKKDNYLAEKNYYQNQGVNGLSDNYICCMKSDLKGNIWALTFKNQLNKINPKTGIVTLLSLSNNAGKLSNGNASSMICDSEGYIWVGFVGGLYRIHSVTNKFEQINKEGFKDHSVRLLVEENNRLWINTSKGTYVLDKSSLEISTVNIPNKEFSSIYYDVIKKEIFLGGVDGYVYFPTNAELRPSRYNQIVLTSLAVNDRLFNSGVDYEGKSIRYAEGITLKHSQNNITLEFSDLNFTENHDDNYVYKLDGVDNEWRIVNPTINRISYINLSPGTYKLTIGALDANQQLLPGFKSFLIEIRPPWYAGFWAKLVYSLLIISLILWVVNYFRERHRSRIERIEKEKSLELSRLKIDFFTNVSHDFKTPLSLIIAPVSKLLVETKNPQLRKQLGLIQQNALRLNGLIQQVIGFERVDDSVNKNMILSPVEFIEFTAGIFTVYESAFQAKGLEANFKSNVENLLVNIDVLKMESVLNNLISNALKFTNTNGKILLDINFSIENERNVTLTISDTGIGIPQADLRSVFDRFYQSRTTSNDKSGSGIGLYLVKNYVEMHGGTIEILSEENVGTTISINLPVVIQDVDFNGIKSTVISETEIDKPLILIVEDNLQVSEFVIQTLLPTYRCISAHNGKSGLDAAFKIKPDLIITDIMMPVMDGMEMCRQLRKIQFLSHIPVIMLTAKDDKVTEEKSIELGVSAFISKPFDTTMLLLRIKQLLGTKEKLEEKLRLEVLSTPGEIKAESWDEKLLADVTKIIEDNVADSEFNVNKLSELSDISTKQIYRRVKQITGLSPVDYIRTIRMKKAAVLLAQNKFSVAEVMYLVGFSNYSYFSKCFTNQFGMSPKQFAGNSKENL